MNITAIFNSFGSIVTIIDGEEFLIPDDTANRYRRMLDESGVQISPYVEPPPPPVLTVSRRQFKMQLAITGLSAEVTEWVASQPELIQIAFNESGSFNRSDEMLHMGFAGLGFTSQQIDKFFADASAL